MDRLENELRKKAVYFVKGTWPELIQQQLPKTFTHGDVYMVAILKAGRGG